MNRRRNFLNALGAGAFAFTLPAIAQPSPFRVCWMSPTGAADGSLFLGELRRGLRELGYAEGRNLRMEPYWGENSAELIGKMIAEVVASNPHVIVAQGGTAPLLRRATTTIPVVFAYSGDPVEAGLVDSLARPGRNLTGISFLVLELVGKRMEMLKEVLPNAKRIAVIANPQHPGDQAERRASQTAATALGMSLEYFEARNVAQLDEALVAIGKSSSDAVMMFPFQTIINHRERIASWSIKSRRPTISGWAQFAEGGNLMSYGPNFRDACRRLAVYVDKILKGAKPADLPVELPTRVELAINMKTAKVLGIKIPNSILVRADKLIE